MLDRAEFARKGIARGRAVVVLRYRDGIVLVAENRSTTLNKIAEIYDRIAFAAVGRYNEFEALRVAGIRHADLRGYSYDRSDVTGRGLAGAYSQLLGAAFSSAAEKPYEVELIVAELGDGPSADVLYRITYDGVISDESELVVIGGDAGRIADTVRAGYSPEASLTEAVQLASSALSSDQVEVGVLERGTTRRRTFRRVQPGEVNRD